MPHLSSKPPGFNLGNRDSTNHVLGTTCPPKGQATTELERNLLLTHYKRAPLLE
jgi:hypothetical protein